jgi:CRP-like cAMP-binding protein
LLETLPHRLLEISTLVHFSAGQTVVLRDDVVEYAYYVLSGELLVCSETADGKFSTWMTMNAPTVVSDLEILAGTDTYAASVSAGSGCIALRSSAVEFSALMRSDANFLWSVARMVGQKNFLLSHSRGNAAFRSSLDKTALFLLQQCAFHPPMQGIDFVLLKTRSRIASEIIISQKTLDRCLIKLRDSGYLTIRHGKIHISASQYQRLLESWGPSC